MKKIHLASIEESLRRIADALEDTCDCAPAPTEQVSLAEAALGSFMGARIVGIIVEDAEYEKICSGLMLPPGQSPLRYITDEGDRVTRSGLPVYPKSAIKGSE